MDYIKNISRVIDPEFGVVRFVVMHQKPIWFSDVKCAVAFCSNSSGAIALVQEEYYRKNSKIRRRSVPGESASKGMGLGYSSEESLIKAICEGIERSCGRSASLKKYEITYDSYESLSRRDNIHHPSIWKILSDDQYDENSNWRPDEHVIPDNLILEELRTDTKINWIRLKEIGENSAWWVPLQTTFLGINTHDENNKDQISMSEPISTGMACGQTINDATLSGIYEVIERDAIMGMWINRLSPPRVDFSTSTIKRASLRKLIKELARTQYEIIINDLTSDFGIPIFLLLYYTARRLTL